MYICENADVCSVISCPHRKDHDFAQDEENACSSPCDVARLGARRSGISGSVCVETDGIEVE